MNEAASAAVMKLFPALFLAMWLAVTTVLGFMSGWFTLQQRYPRGDGPALLKLRWRSGSMGAGVGLNGILTLTACRSGLRISISKLFGPFQRPFLVPWQEISSEPATAFFAPMTKLRFGRPEFGTLKIDARTWQRLASFSSNTTIEKSEPVSRASAARGLLLQWAVTSVLIGGFFYFASHADPRQQGLPPALCFVFPASVFGIAQLIRFLRQL